MVSTVHPEGIPLAPVVHTEGSGQTNVPVGDTLLTHPKVQLVAEISVAKHFI